MRSPTRSGAPEVRKGHVFRPQVRASPLLRFESSRSRSRSPDPTGTPSEGTLAIGKIQGLIPRHETAIFTQTKYWIASSGGFLMVHWETRLSYPDRQPFEVWIPSMPRLPDLILDCVVYLYRSEDAAYEGEQAGGTGFLVGVKSQVSSDGMYAYLVTNKQRVPCVLLRKARAEQAAYFASIRPSLAWSGLGAHASA
jgi:hypothetical protein